MTAPAPWRAERAVREEETARLFAEARHADDATRDELLRRVAEINTCVAHAVAHRYRGRDVEMADLEQVACLALVRAAQRFDPERSENFLTYAVPTITGELRRYFRDHGWTVRPPRRLQEVRSQVSSVRDTLPSDEFGRPASEREIAKVLDLPVGDVSEALRLDTCFSPDSLDVDPATSPRVVSVDDGHDAPEARAILEPLLGRLTERQRRLVHLRFVRDLTQSEIGAELGVSQVQVSRLLAQVYDTLRDGLGVHQFSDVA
ncbi:sigma-70 family RNA polymerase sigma factor [Nocardioides sp. SYSU D00038]|uniref:sigma-70 family RNA polymerase sigma factor n=1 Tax=Nocardioides sp. SYSU D00038 TaxID=2812554 RepID=UPI0019688476|nr:sigma-70 family RNA polymerase sigma factor [Nocardioides sp. SYSU D00038]